MPSLDAFEPPAAQVVFNPSVALGELAMAKTQFGTHIVQVTERDLGAGK
jgi:hypothetical protein